jgi:glyoxylase-like metal-dependent hydrolase (beta-lactamase superfamily II)
MIGIALPLLIALAGLPPAARADDGLVAREIATGVYAFIGDGGEPEAGNRGFAANSGFVVGESGVVVIDTGASRRHGERMLAAIARTTPLPVVLVIDTHATQEFIFGNGAFADRGIPILAHRETVKLMKARCAHCLENLRPALGAELEGTSLVLPTREVEGDTRLDAGGRRLELIHPGWAATPGDLAVLDTATGTLFAGGLATSRRIPEIRDCDFESWLQALDRLAALSPRRVVPGFGPPSGPEAIAATAEYLRALDTRVKTLYARSGSLLDALDQAGLPAYERWTRYGELHRRNAQHRYLQLEARDLGADPRSVAQPQ